MTKLRKLLIVCLGIVLVSGCAYRAYFGLHGTSIKLHPEIHAGVSTDSECLQCHSPEHPLGPPTPHPDFTGCLKCHNDEVLP